MRRVSKRVSEWVSGREVSFLVNNLKFNYILCITFLCMSSWKIFFFSFMSGSSNIQSEWMMEKWEGGDENMVKCVGMNEITTLSNRFHINEEIKNADYFLIYKNSSIWNGYRSRFFFSHNIWSSYRHHYIIDIPHHADWYLNFILHDIHTNAIMDRLMMSRETS